jgi:membrane protein
MSSSVAAGLWVAFCVGLLVGLWAEEVERRSPRRLGVSRWVPAALGVLRGELVTLLGLMVLLVLRPVSWVPFVVLVVMAGLVGRVRFMRLVRRRCWWWLVAGVGLVVSWPAVVAVFLPATAPLGVRVGAGYLVMIVACWVLSVTRFVAGVVASAQGGAGRPGEYVAVPVSEGAG